MTLAAGEFATTVIDRCALARAGAVGGHRALGNFRSLGRDGENGLQGRGAVLVLEQAAITALDVEEMLLECGVDAVLLADGPEQAMRLMREHRPRLAILNVRAAGDEAMAMIGALVASGVALILTGRMEGIANAVAPDIHVLAEPFSLADLADALARFR